MTGRRLLTIAALGLLLAAPLAAGKVELYPTPVTENARAVQTLFNATLLIGMIVFIGVEALLFFIIWKFRKNKVVPAGETHRGHTKAEIAWTIIPAVILLGLGSFSAATLFEIDTLPEDPDFHVRVEAQQFLWRFVYPDNSSSINDLRVEEGSIVQLDLVSRDVEHQFFVPAFALKISAIPGRTNHAWFEAPGPGNYHMECTMYCGFGHHEMGAASENVKVTVFAKGSQTNPYGRAAPPTPTPATNTSG